MSRHKETSQEEQETLIEAWLTELSEFIVEANTQTWAADGSEVEPERQGYQELEYERENWRLRDSYTGYFRAPGMTTVYYKDQPVWTMSYAGEGMTEGNEGLARETFSFLKKALMKVSPEMPYRGPDEYREDDFRYTFLLVDGGIEEYLGEELIHKGPEIVFTQTLIGGLVLPRDENREVQFPWNL